MDYDTVELLVGGALAFAPVIALVLAGLWCMKKPRIRIPLFFAIGLLASLAYGWVAPQLAFRVVPPPFDPYYADGNALDVRGLILSFGAMVGCAAGLVTTVVMSALALARPLWRKRTATPNTRGAGVTRSTAAAQPPHPQHPPRKTA